MSLGTQQDERRPDALRPDGILPDERRLADRIAMLCAYAGILSGAPTHGPSWGALLDGDPSGLIAQLLAYPLPTLQKGFLDDFAANRRREMERRLQETTRWLGEWLRRLDLVQQADARALAVRIEQILLASLGPDWQARSGQRQHSAREMIAAVADWPTADRQERPRSRDLRVVFFALMEALDRIRALASVELGPSLETKSHEPAAALLLALAQILDPVRDRLNTFTGRHLEFYYRDCLQFKPLGPQPDTVHLVFTRDPKLAPDASVTVPANQEFVAGRTAAGADIVFTALDSLDVTEAQVSALKTLRLERNPLVAPECDLGFVTRARAAAFAADVGPEAVTRRETVALMGGDVVGCARGGDDARIGLAISSPTLLMSQGERYIRLTLEFDLTPGLGPQEVAAEPPTAADAADETPPPTTRRPIGDQFAAWLLTDGEEQPIDDAAFVEKYSTGSDPTDPLVLFVGKAAVLESLSQGAERRMPTLRERRTLVRQQLYGDFFTIEVSTPTGWFEVSEISPLEAAAPSAGASPKAGKLALQLQLLNEDPAVAPCDPGVHGPEWPAGAPVLRLTVYPQARIYPLSLFDRTELRSVTLEVQVIGLRELKAYNQLGQVDPSKPFLPLGPLPDLGAYLVVGAAETARKELTGCTLVLEWGPLPPDGFAAYYDGYDARYDDESFRVQPAVLCDGRWTAAGEEQPLFANRRGNLQAETDLRFDRARLHALWRPSQGTGVYDQNARDGLFRIQLSSPADGFGQRLYPPAMIAALRPKLIRVGNEPPVIPNPPFSPTVSRLTLDYEARTKIIVGSTEASPDRLLHILPFGVKTIQPAPSPVWTPVLPRFDRDGSLFVGLAASALQGGLSLLFELRQDTANEDWARRRVQEPGRQGLTWWWLADEAWTLLDDKRVLQDTTRGFLTSGVVKLDLPPGLTRGSMQLDSGLFWLRAASSWPSESFAGLQGAHAQALRAVRRDPGPADDPLPAGQITIKSARIPGIVVLRQPGRSFGLRRAEAPDAERTRIAERLRHKGRAATPWDVERLVLQAFPGVYKVRCLPHARIGVREPQPGSMLVVVVPAAPRDDPDYATRALQIDALTVERIAQFLPPLASPHASVMVHNAMYERIQVRCEVELAPGARFGDALKRLNSAIVDYLSPWRDGGHQACFDWVIRADDVEAAVRAVDGVRSVSGLSLISVRESQRPAVAAQGYAPAGPPEQLVELYDFDDTAVTEAEADVPLIRARWPWTLALPVADHIVTLEGAETSSRAMRTGVALGGPPVEGAVAGLEIGSTFVVGGL